MTTAMSVVTSFLVMVLLSAMRCSAIIDVNSEAACHNKFGRWVTVTMKDSGIPVDGWEGNYLHFQNDALEDITKFTLASNSAHDSESFCLDYLGDDFSKCYTIYMDDGGHNPHQVSWTVKISTANSGADWRTDEGVDQWVSGGDSAHGWNPDTGTMEAYKDGGSPADVKVLCGRLFKKLGKYSMKQIDKVSIDHMSNEDNMFYKSQSALSKIESYAQMLNLYVADSDSPSAVDKDDWFDGDMTTTTTVAEDTTTAEATTTVNSDCDDCGASCTGCAVDSWRGDGQCDDDNNSCGCNWDGGDCCGDTAQTLYCTDCECLDPEYSRRLLRSGRQ